MERTFRHDGFEELSGDWEKENEKYITPRDTDAMTGEELRALVRRHIWLLGKRGPKGEENFYRPQIIDEPRLLRRLCQWDPEEFSRMVLEKHSLDDIAGKKWAAVLYSQGGTFPEEILRRAELKMPDGLTRVNGDLEYDRPLAIDTAILLDVSQKARELWVGQYPRYIRQKTKGEQLVKGLELREDWLDIPPVESLPLFYDLGWTPLDVMLAFLVSSVFTNTLPMDPDCAAAAAGEDPETAVRLLDPDSCKELFPGECHPGYYVEMAKVWTEFLYISCGWQDLSPLEKGHRTKKMAAHYRQVLDRLEIPDWERREFEKELAKAGLLPGETPPNWENPKMAKLQRLALTKALTRQYLWRREDLLGAFAAGKPEVFTGLLWGIYEGERLAAPFLLDERGNARGEDGEVLTLPEGAEIGLVAPAELTKPQLTLWKKRLKETGGKPAIRQLSLPGQAPDFGDLQGAVTKHITIFTTAGKWGLEMGELPEHRRADLLDPLHGYGARIDFENIWNGPEYNSDEVTLLGVTFFRMGKTAPGDRLSRKAIVSPEELPPRFVSLAGAAFKQLAGLK